MLTSLARVLLLSQLASGLRLSANFATGQTRAAALAQISMFDEPSKAFEMPSPVITRLRPFPLSLPA